MYRLWVVVALVIMIVLLLYRFRLAMMRSIVMNRLPRNDPDECVCMVIDGRNIMAGEPGGRRVHTMIIHDERGFMASVFSRGEVGLGESYMRGEWSCPDLLGFMCFLVRTVPRHGTSSMRTEASQDDAKNISHHYDVSNDFYGLFLTDPWRAYSCGIWDDEGADLASAQKRKIDIIIDKLRIPRGCEVLDVGCGWGRIADYVSKTCDCTVVGLTLSKEQHDFAREAFPKVDVRLVNFLDQCPGRFSRIYSIGMFEHVRARNYNRFFRRIRQSMADGNSRFVLHSIISTCDDIDSMERQKPSFVTTHIFPGGQIPRMKWIRDSLEGTDLKIVHEEIFPGQHYAQTLKAWRENLERSHVEDQTLFRKYIYYFTTCEALFREGRMGVVHLVIMPGTVQTIHDNFVYPQCLTTRT